MACVMLLRSKTWTIVLWCSCMLLVARARAAEAPAPLFVIPKVEARGPLDSTIRLEVNERIRGEFVDWFATAPDGPVPNYRDDFFANKLQIGVRVTRDPVEFFAQVQHTILASLPDGAPGPGGSYFANTHSTFQQEPIFRSGYVRLRGEGLTLTGGRQLYRDGFEFNSSNRTIQWIKKNRIAERLIGPFDYTNIGRSFDGGQIAYDNDWLNVTGLGVVPTAGGFEISANREIRDIFLAGVSAGLKETQWLPGTEGRLFWIFYTDQRDIVFVDNRSLEARKLDHDGLYIQTIGANLTHVHDLGPGRIDLLLWAAGQTGDWQSLTQRAWAYVVEAGYQLPQVWAAPWLRGGINSTSGDSDNTDGRHNTFFQILPTARIYAQFPFYNMMNMQDVFAQLVCTPHRMVSIRTDLHWLRVNESPDFLYSGGGATSSNNVGYTGTPTSGHHEVAYVPDIALTLALTEQLSFYAYYGHAFGQGVINSAFQGRDANYGYLEATLAF